MLPHKFKPYHEIEKVARDEKGDLIDHATCPFAKANQKFARFVTLVNIIINAVKLFLDVT